MEIIAASTYPTYSSTKRLQKQPNDVEAWQYYNIIPEVKRLLTDHASMLSSFNYKLIANDGTVLDDAEYTDFVEQLALNQVVKMFSICSNVDAQGYFVTPTWDNSLQIQCYASHHVSLQQSRGKYKVGTELVDEEYVENWFIPSPDLVSVGWLSSAKRLCKKIVQLEKAVIAQALSNVPGHIFFVPLEATPKEMFKEGDQLVPETRSAQSKTDSLQTIIADMITGAMSEYAEGAQVQAGIVGLHSQFIEFIKQGMIDLSRPIDQNIHIELEQAIKQLAKSGPLPPEDLLGFGVTNRWNSKEIAKQRLQTYLVPEANMFCEYVAPLVARLAKENGLDDVAGVIADPTPLYAQPDLSDVAGEALQLGVISKKSYAILSGIPLEYVEDNPDKVEVLSASTVTEENVLNEHFQLLENAFASVMSETLQDLFLAYAKRVDAKSKNLARKNQDVKEAVQGKGALYELIESADVYYDQVAQEDLLTDEEKAAIISVLLVYMSRSEYVGEFTARELEVLRKEAESGELGSMRSKDHPTTGVERIVEKIEPLVLAGFVEKMRERIVGYLVRRKNNPNGIGYRIDGEKSLEKFFSQHDIFEVAQMSVQSTSFLVNPYLENINGFRSKGRKIWFYGDITDRQAPYIQHVVLDGEVTEGDMIAGYYPGDHKNCQCSFVDIIERV
jgi:hypothetical protein